MLISLVFTEEDNDKPNLEVFEVSKEVGNDAFTSPDKSKNQDELVMYIYI